ncbi:MAG: FkbM family methyltransferase [Gammaproteobacteria bacterium]|nr:FkbM family methyltransferase [Gammaproteobacteria bacterium]MDH5803050.1 FkbM family methyltransferase [Gammaproteobacteria bacterium]
MGEPDIEVSDKFLDLAKQVKNPIICDIGSRDAVEGLYLQKTLNAKKLHIFEPNPEAIAKCKNNIGETPNVVMNEFALSDSIGEIEFYPVDSEASDRKDIGLSSMYKVNPNYTKSRGKIEQSIIKVQTSTLDDYFKDQEAPTILWVDVEGAELKVFQGGLQTLKNVELIHVEVGFRQMHVGKPLFWEINQFLEQQDFRFEGFVEYSTLKTWLYVNKWLPNLPWRANAIYRRKS